MSLHSLRRVTIHKCHKYFKYSHKHSIFEGFLRGECGHFESTKQNVDFLSTQIKNVADSVFSAKVCWVIVNIHDVM